MDVEDVQRRMLNDRRRRRDVVTAEQKRRQAAAEEATRINQENRAVSHKLIRQTWESRPSVQKGQRR